MEVRLKDHVCFRLYVALLLIVAPNAMAASYSDVWQITQQGAYSSLPSHPTTLSSFYSGGVNLLARSANRTFTSDADTLPRFQKLVHPIGICFSGTWKITQPTNYTGYFSNGSEGLIIVRASEALGQPNRGDYRSFGFAGKLFPTTDPNDGRDYRTANFFTVDDLGGTNSRSFLELGKSNAPDTSFHLSTVFSLPMIGTIAKTFLATDVNAPIRQLYPISELDLSRGHNPVTPARMVITSDGYDSGRAVPNDFRRELQLWGYQNRTLSFGINVAATPLSQYKRIGTITLTQEALSDGCDHRLHFQHPRWKN